MKDRRYVAIARVSLAVSLASPPPRASNSGMEFTCERQILHGGSQSVDIASERLRLECLDNKQQYRHLIKDYRKAIINVAPYRLQTEGRAGEALGQCNALIKDALRRWRDGERERQSLRAQSLRKLRNREFLKSAASLSLAFLYGDRRDHPPLDPFASEGIPRGSPRRGKLILG